ncbi:hypothetical protein DFJ58DRAFT_854770 [Suillus subalutaceus]|uniref:uncharacterized protein n=1 Tax=Suillus subalutaceus TaxID=48586 RepID=UPI001B8808B7|nr:uncharacterized protein DFJ58DRAFT_854770 [Suillus subalutaceus]KAG1842997.1 hypothetical protein DFJ58DRAFT_854770 [Suillus subalutaceus]
MFIIKRLSRRPVVHDPGGNRSAGTIIISHYTKLASSIMDDAAGIIDNPENGLLLEVVLRTYFGSYAWCLHPAVRALVPPCPFWFGRFFTQVQFRDHSQSGIQPPNPTLIALHSAVAHVLYLSGAADVIDKVYDAFLDDGPMTLVDWVDDEQPPSTNEPSRVGLILHEADVS